MAKKSKKPEQKIYGCLLWCDGAVRYVVFRSTKANAEWVCRDLRDSWLGIDDTRYQLIEHTENMRVEKAEDAAELEAILQKLTYEKILRNNPEMEQKIRRYLREWTSKYNKKGSRK